MTALRVGTANLDKDVAAGDLEQLRHLRAVLGTGVLCIQEAGSGIESTRVEAHGVKSRALPQWVVGDVGVHRGVARRWVTLDGVTVRVFSVHALHIKTSGRVAQDTYYRGLAAGIARRAEPWVVAGDFNRHHRAVAAQLGGRSVGDGIIGVVVSPGLRVGGLALDHYGLDRHLTDHPAVFATVTRS